ncbi:MAG: hypothetical protein KA715_06525 [Xanthomonadaceae bacterium]|nr:hypothetical protein [Xanthomonadaceae bacterium]
MISKLATYIFLSCLSVAFAHAESFNNLGELFEQHFHQRYNEGKCGSNSRSFLSRGLYHGLIDEQAEAKLVTVYYPSTDTQLKGYQARTRDHLDSRIKYWDYHVFPIVKNDENYLVFDTSYRNIPSITKLETYIINMFQDQKDLIVVECDAKKLLTILRVILVVIILMDTVINLLN